MAAVLPRYSAAARHLRAKNGISYRLIYAPVRYSTTNQRLS